MNKAIKSLYSVNQFLWTHMLLTHGKRGPAFPPLAWCPDCQRLGMDWN